MSITVYIEDNGKITIHYPERMTEEEALAQVYSGIKKALAHEAT